MKDRIERFLKQVMEFVALTAIILIIWLFALSIGMLEV